MNVGCGIGTQDTMTYGDGFNNEGGGVYATEWTGEAIRVFHFVRSNIPADILAGNPDPTTWGAPLALFTGCDFDTYVKNQTIVFDTTFCGQWAGQKEVWQADPVCSKKAATCEDYVKNNPADFAGAYWDVNSVKVYQQNGGFIGSAPVAPKPSTMSTMSYTQGVPPTLIPSTMVTMTAPIIPIGTVQSVQMVTVDIYTTMTVDMPGVGVGQGTGIPNAPQSIVSRTHETIKEFRFPVILHLPLSFSLLSDWRKKIDFFSFIYSNISFPSSKHPPNPKQPHPLQQTTVNH